MESLKVNIIPVEFLKNKFNVYLSNTELDSSYITLDDKRREKIETDKKYLYLSESDDKELSNIEIFTDIYITKRYLNYKVSKYFEDIQQGNNLIVDSGFINTTEVYLNIGQKKHKDKEFDMYQQFFIRAEYIEEKRSFGYIVSSGGIKCSLKKTYSEYSNEINKEKINKVIYKGKILRYPKIEESAINLDDAFVLCSKDLFEIFPPLEYQGQGNKYKKIYLQIKEFCKKYLLDQQIDDIVRIESSGFLQIEKSNIFKTSKDSNSLCFSNEQKHFNAYMGLNQYGAYKMPRNVEKIKFIFIFHKDDKDVANKFYAYSSKGLKSFPGFRKFIGISVDSKSLDKEKTIIYENDNNPYPEIEEKIESFQANDSKYVAFYFSRISRDEKDETKLQVYYKIKELLLKKNIVSQTIYTEHIYNQYFNYFLPNIAIALLAKLGGIPWKLSRTVKNDIIVGVGAKRREDQIYYGNTICFKNDGTFETFDVFHNNNLEPLGEAFKGAIEKYVRSIANPSRLVIHFYKQMNKYEEEKLLKIFKELNVSIPFVVLTINDKFSDDFVFFDEGFDGVIPVSGRYIKVRRKLYLLANNERYSDQATMKMSDYPLPIKIQFSKWKDVDLDNDQVIAEIIDQVYQFSRVYWRSVKQKSKPVTILYSEKIAEITSFFETGNLPETDISHERLWFL